MYMTVHVYGNKTSGRLSYRFHANQRMKVAVRGLNHTQQQ